MKIAIVICTCNRPDRLASAAGSCLAQSLLPDEILIIDDGNLTEDFLIPIRQQCEAKQIKFTYIHKPAEHQGLTVSRNIGFRTADAQIIQYLDDDAELHVDCLARADELFTADTYNELAAIDFPILEQARLWRGRRIVDFCYKLAGWWQIGRHFIPSHAKPGVLAEFADVHTQRFLQGGSMAIRREYLHRIGGFDESLGRYACGEDKDISLRLSQLGVLARITSIGVVHHSEQTSRIGNYELGIETSYNYLYINWKQGSFGMGERLLICYNLGVLLAMEFALMIVGDKRSHWQQIKGMVIGIRKFAERLWRNKTA
jgi:glucosyl-dolichyl phosphate glucuronosyltransferase